MDSQKKLFADIEINEAVIVFSKDGHFVDEGIITRIENRKTSFALSDGIVIQVGLNEYTLYKSSWSNDLFFFNKSRWDLALNQTIVDEMANVASRYATYSSRNMSTEQCEAIMVKVNELLSLVKPIAESVSERSCTPESFLRMWGLSSHTPEAISKDFLDKQVFLPYSYRDHISEIVSREQPSNVVSILDGNVIELANKAANQSK